MTTYYVDPTATGDDDGSSQANAWSTLQRAIDGTDGTQPAAGDTVLCKHTGADGAVDETLTVSIDVDGNSGSTTAGHIKYIGANSSWEDDGTQYVIDANDAAIYCLKYNANYIYLKNFFVKQATDDGIGSSNLGPDYLIFDNVRSSSNGSDGFGFGGGYSYFPRFIRCLADNNSGYGFQTARYTTVFYFLCCARDNTSYGFETTYGQLVAYGCLSFDNGSRGYRLGGAGTNGQSGIVLNSVADGNSLSGININAANHMIIGNRITNHSGTGDIGLEGNNYLFTHGWNYLENNDGDNIQEDSLGTEILYNGAITNQEDQSDTNQGYTSLTEGSEDYNLRSDATLRRTAITIPTGQ